MAKIKKPKANSGKRISVQEPIDYDKRPPIFSLERIQNGPYCLSNLDQEHKAMFADAIYKRRTLSWNQIKNIDRHGLGTEKIAKSSIKTAIPAFITEDFNELLAFRFHGLKPMVGYRLNDIFFVLWFDHDYTLYPH